MASLSYCDCDNNFDFYVKKIYFNLAILLVNFSNKLNSFDKHAKSIMDPPIMSVDVIVSPIKPPRYNRKLNEQLI